MIVTVTRPAELQLTVDSHPDDEEGHQHVDHIEAHQSVLGTREASTHLSLWNKKYILYS